MRVSVALGRTARAACLACLRRRRHSRADRQFRLEPGQQFGVRRAAGVGGGGEDLLRVRGRPPSRGQDDLRVVLGDVALRQLRVGEVAVPDQLVGAGPRDAGDVERHRRVFEHREVADVDDVSQICGVGRGSRVGFGPALIARTAGELHQRGAAVGVGAPRHVRRRKELGLGDQLYAQRRGLGHGSP